MKEEKRGPVNRCFGAKSPKNSDQEKEEALKAVLKKAAEKRKEDARREDAGRVLKNLRVRLRRKRLADLLTLAETLVKRGEMPPYVFEELIRRIEGQRTRNELSLKEIVDLEKAKASPVRQPE